LIARGDLTRGAGKEGLIEDSLDTDDRCDMRRGAGGGAGSGGKPPERPVRRVGLLKAAAAIAAVGICVAALGAVLVYRTTFGGVTLEKVSIDMAPYDSPPRRVSGVLIFPDNPVSIPAPGVVFSHGLMMTKESFIEQCRALAGEGLVVLAIDLKGHGATGGANDAGLTERKDVWAAVDYLSGVPGVDPERIAVGGHSLGAIASTTAGIYQHGDGIKTVVAIAGQPGRKEAAELLFGDIDDFLGRLWPFLGWSRQWDINSAEDLAERNIIPDITVDRPPNYLLIVGEHDSALPVDTARMMMEKATGRPDFQVGHTYGAFDDGTARRMEVTGDTHSSEVYSSEVWDALASWVLESFDLPFDGKLRIKARMRYAGGACVFIGFFLVGLGALYLVRYAVEGSGPPVDTVALDSGGRRATVMVAVVSVALFGLISLFTFPFSRATGIRALVPFLGADLYSSLAASRTLLLIGAAVLVLAFERTKGGHLHRSGKLLNPAVALKSLLTGVVTVAVLMLLYAPTAHLLYLNGEAPVSLWGFFAFAAIVTAQLYFEQEYFHHFMLPAFSPTDSVGKRVRYILMESAVRGVAFGLAFIPLVANPMYVVGRQGEIRLPVVPVVMIAGFFLFLPASALGLYARRRGYSVIAPALFLGLMASVLVGCLFAVQVF